MSNREKIDKFLNDLETTEGFLPKFAHNQNPDSKKVFYSGPVFGKEEMGAAIEALLFGKWASAGEYCQKFEQEFSKEINKKYSVMVNSGSSANLVMIAALKEYYKWQDGDEVIVSVVGFPTTVSALVQNGLKPVFIDIEFDTLNFNLDLIDAKITDRTKAIFLSPVLGNPPDIDELELICEDSRLKLILDGCDSLGSKWRGSDLSQYAVAASCSFYVAHHISSIEGGAVSSNIEEIISIARSFASWGRGCFCTGQANFSQNGCCGKRFSNWLPQFSDLVIDHRYLFDYMGYNLKPLDICGAIGLEQLKKLDKINKNRKYHKEKIQISLINYLPQVSFQNVLHFADPAWFGLGVICPNKDYKERVVRHFETNGVQTRNYFAGNLLVHKGYSHLGNWAEYPMANQVLERVFFLGCSPTYTQDQLAKIEFVASRFHE